MGMARGLLELNIPESDTAPTDHVDVQVVVRRDCGSNEGGRNSEEDIVFGDDEGNIGWGVNVYETRIGKSGSI